MVELMLNMYVCYILSHDVLKLVCFIPLHIGLGWGIGQNNLWKEIFLSTEKNNCNFWQVRYFKWRRFLSSTLIFFTVNWTQTTGFVTALIPLLSLYGISCRFEFHNLRRAWNCQHWLFIIWHVSLFTVMMELQFLHGVSL